MCYCVYVVFSTVLVHLGVKAAKQKTNRVCKSNEDSEKAIGRGNHVLVLR